MWMISGTLLNVSSDEVAVESSDYHKAVRMFKEWQSQSEGTYQCLRKTDGSVQCVCGKRYTGVYTELYMHILHGVL